MGTLESGKSYGNKWRKIRGVRTKRVLSWMLEHQTPSQEFWAHGSKTTLREVIMGERELNESKILLTPQSIEGGVEGTQEEERKG